jgi:hypothetical protein
VLPAPVEVYVASFMAFYERGFGMPPQPFLRSLLLYYGLKLHHLTPSRVLYIAVFVTLCEAHLGVDPDLDLWKYFFRVRHPQDPEAELTISGGTVIHVKSGHRVDPYLEIPMPRLSGSSPLTHCTNMTATMPCLVWPTVGPSPVYCPFFHLPPSLRNILRLRMVPTDRSLPTRAQSVLPPQPMWKPV